MTTTYMDIATLVTAIAGLVTALVTYLSVRELKLARTISSAPVLVLKNMNFTADCSRDGNADFGPNSSVPDLEVLNFGNGPALEVKCTWVMNERYIIELLNSFDPHGQYSIGFEPSPFSPDETIRLYWNHFYQRQLISFQNPIVPSAVTPTSKISLPPFYLESFHMYIRLAVHARPDNSKAFELKEFPPTTLIIAYTDLAGLDHFDNYSIELSYNHNGTRLLEEKDSYACFLSAKKVS